QTKISTHHVVAIFWIHAMIADYLETSRHRGILCQSHSSVSECPEIFGRIKAQKTKLPYPPRAFPPVVRGIFRSNCLRCILNHRNAKTGANQKNFVHFATQTKEVNRNNRLHRQPFIGPKPPFVEGTIGTEELFEASRGQVKCIPIDIDKNQFDSQTSGA